MSGPIMLRVHLRDIDHRVVDAWREAGLALAGFEISQGDIFLGGRHDAIVAAGNSAGVMDGGLDLVYRNHFGMHVERITRQLIGAQWGGLLPVGEAVAVPTKSEAIPLMIYAPTMERPMDVSGTQNAELAFSAALRLAVRLDIKSLLCPGLCTLTGRMPPDVAAAQMMQAWRHVLHTHDARKA